MEAAFSGPQCSMFEQDCISWCTEAEPTPGCVCLGAILGEVPIPFMTSQRVGFVSARGAGERSGWANVWGVDEKHQEEGNNGRGSFMQRVTFEGFERHRGDFDWIVLMLT